MAAHPTTPASGIRFKRLIHVPALVAMTTTQIPIVPVTEKEPPTHRRSRRSIPTAVRSTDAWFTERFYDPREPCLPTKLSAMAFTQVWFLPSSSVGCYRLTSPHLAFVITSRHLALTMLGPSADTPQAIGVPNARVGVHAVGGKEVARGGHLLGVDLRHGLHQRPVRWRSPCGCSLMCGCP